MENRLEYIYEAASSLFINKGYARTQMKDIAREIGLSTGMIYIYFKGKKDILNFILKCTIDKGFMQQEFTYPIDESLFENLDDEIDQVLIESSARFYAPLKERRPGYSFAQMVSDAYDTISRYGTGCLVIEKNMDAVGKAGRSYQEYRKIFFDQVLEYVNFYIERGEVRPMKYTELSTRLIIETLAWWGMHVMNDVFQVQKNIPAEAAKEVCMDNLVSAYAKGNRFPED